MTAEIAVLNNEAVALSADSASTVLTGAGPKVFNSVSKIFGLTPAEPVGIMVYGQSTFLGVPWETIIRAFRDSRPEKPKKELVEYGAELIGFIEKWPDLFPSDVQARYVDRTIRAYFGFLWEEITEKVESRWNSEGPLRRSQLKAIAAEEIAAHRRLWKEAPDTDGGLAGKADEVRSEFAGLIRAARLEIFKGARITSGSARNLSDIAVWLFTKRPPLGTHPEASGVVIAGFGTSEYFPKLANYEVEGMAFGSVKYTEGDPVIIGRQAEAAAVVPFAQHESVRAFMEGIHPSARVAIGQEIDRLLSDYPAEVLATTGISDETRAQIIDAFAKQRQAERDRIKGTVTDHIEREHVSPVLDIVSVLPKDELAMMAESLVNLTSFRHRVSFGAETVGGPIDVAVISKGDGFVWIKRKHYFRQELNPHFIAHKYGGKA